MGVVPKPTKSMLIALAVELEPEPAAELTFRVTLAVCVKEPLVPVIVRVELPAGVLPLVATVIVELVPGAIELELNVAVAPAGIPFVTLSFTVPVNPFNAAALTV